MFEDPRFEAGTKNFVQQLKRLTDAGVEVYVGGGEGGAAVERYGKPDFIKHCFTAGGTVLNALGSAPVPYLQALYMAAKRYRRRRATRRGSSVSRFPRSADRRPVRWRESSCRCGRR
jgi:hypothetical protein